jgi:hypothetical protein
MLAADFMWEFAATLRIHAFQNVSSARLYALVAIPQVKVGFAVRDFRWSKPCAGTDRY